MKKHLRGILIAVALGLIAVLAIAGAVYADTYHLSSISISTQNSSLTYGIAHAVTYFDITLIIKTMGLVELYPSL